MVVISYDISDDKRLSKVAKFLEERGFRVQKSVFELDVSTRKANSIFKELSQLIDEEDGDKCFMFSIDDKEDIKARTSAERIF